MRIFLKLIFVVMTLFSLLGTSVQTANLAPSNSKAFFTQTFKSKRCGESASYPTNDTVWVVVVGSATGLNCIITITPKYLKYSDFEAGFACVSKYTAKPVFVVSPDDSRVKLESSYPRALKDGRDLGKELKVPVRVAYINTSDGPPHPQRECEKMP